MSDEPKSFSNLPNAEPAVTRAHLPMWILLVMLLVMFGGGIYFDRHSGWFNAQVYAPYGSMAELESYQPKSGAAALFAQGKKSYEFVCGTCHGVDGMGKPGQFPPLAGSEWVNTKGFRRLAQIPLKGLGGPIQVKGQEWNASMAAMGALLPDADLAAVLTYIRGSWGNKAGEVTADDIKAIRASLAGHTQQMTAEALKSSPE